MHKSHLKIVFYSITYIRRTFPITAVPQPHHIPDFRLIYETLLV